MAESSQLQQTVQNFRTLLSISTQMTAERDLDLLLQLIIDACNSICQCERSTIFLLNEHTNELWNRVAHGEEIEEIRFPADRGVAGYVVANGCTLNIPDAYLDPRFNPEFDRQTGYRTRSKNWLSFRA